MGNIIKATVDIKTEEDKKKFKLALEKVFEFAKKVLESEDHMGFTLWWGCDKNPDWLRMETEEEITITCEYGDVFLHKHPEIKPPEKYIFDFGKPSPAEPRFLLVIFTIIKAFLPIKVDRECYQWFNEFYVAKLYADKVIEDAQPISEVDEDKERRYSRASRKRSHSPGFSAALFSQSDPEPTVAASIVSYIKKISYP